MRKVVLLLAPAFLALVAVVACEDDSSGVGGTLLLDASLADFNAPPPGFDGSVEDAKPAILPVTVTITGRNGPTANVRVVFHDAAGAVLETKVTGNDGKATSTGAIPAMASALLASGSQRHIVTWTGVETGDELQLRDLESGGESVGTYNVTLPGPFSDSGATIYHVESECGGVDDEGTTPSLTLYRYCVRTQNAVLATGRDPNDLVTGHSFKKGNPAPTDGGTIAVATGEWKLPSTLDLSVTNVPGDTSVNSQLLEIADGAGYVNRSANNAQGANVSFKTANGFADAYQASIQVLSLNGSMQGLTKRFNPAPTVAFDFAQLLPPITSTTAVTTNARRPVISWTSSSTAGSDGGLVQIRFSGSEDASYDWTFVVPPGSTTVTGPAMPPEADSFLPIADAGPDNVSFRQPEVLFVEADTLASYAVFRRQQGTLIGLRQGFDRYTLPALPANGTYRTSAISPD